MVDYGPPLIVDVGSSTIKAGLAGQSASLIPACIATSSSETFVGEKPLQRASELRFTYPLAAGAVHDWDQVEALWQHVFNTTKAARAPVLLAEPLQVPTQDRARLAELLYEKFRVPALYIEKQPRLSLYANGAMTGVVLDSGESTTQAVAVYEGFGLQAATMSLKLAGKQVTERFTLLLRRSGYTFSTSGELELVKYLKEQSCHVENPNDTEENTAEQSTYQLPDGQEVTVGVETTKAPEILFSPRKAGFEGLSLAECVAETIKRADIDLRRDLLRNVYLAGGTTLMQGFGSRLLEEVSKVTPKEIKLRMTAPADPVLSVWNGGGVLAGLDSFKQLWVSQQQFQEQGLRAFS